MIDDVPITNAEREECAKVCERAWDTLDAFKQAYPENWHEEDEQVLKDLLKADLKLSGVKLKWQGLTDEERKSIREWQRIQEELGPVWAPMMLYLYEAIEAKLKEKNG